jgi:hypothetical protein
MADFGASGAQFFEAGQHWGGTLWGDEFPRNDDTVWLSPIRHNFLTF